MNLNHQTTKAKINQNSQVLDVFATTDLVAMWQRKTGKEITQELGSSARTGANYTSALLDTITATKLIGDLGYKGKVALKNVNGKQYVIFKGYAGLRSIFTGTRYLATNPKVVDMAIGKVGVNKSIISGARLTIFLVVPLNILNHILSDGQTMSRLIGSTAADLVKVGVASAIASLAATATAALTTLAAGPLIVAIVVGLAVAFALDELDKKYGLTEAFVKYLDDTYDNTIGEAKRQINRAEKQLKWNLLNGFSGSGIFY